MDDLTITNENGDSLEVTSVEDGLKLCIAPCWTGAAGITISHADAELLRAWLGDQVWPD